MLKSQKYSEIVFNNVKAAAGDAATAKSYKSLCKRSGGIFRTVGLVQFAAFIAAKGTKHGHYQILSDHLRQELNSIGVLSSQDQTSYLNRVRTMSLPDFMNTSRAVLILLQWHKRMAEILIAGEADDEEDR